MKGALRSFSEEIQNLNICNINEVIIQTQRYSFFHKSQLSILNLKWINKNVFNLKKKKNLLFLFPTCFIHFLNIVTVFNLLVLSGILLTLTFLLFSGLFHIVWFR